MITGADSMVLKDRKFPCPNIVHFSGRNSDINLVELGEETVKEDDRAVLFEGGTLQSASPRIKAPLRSWMQNKSINSVALYKDCLCNTSLVLEGSKIKDWRKNSMPRISVVPQKGANILAMEVVEDFIYLNCSTSMSSLSIWLRGAQHKVRRLSARSKITSILSANDMILYGTETRLIKGWILL
ncbi:WD repeat domain-containing protein [Forsythia ovata]|uniref:WD repeat domain-containing protein n=1 Tax=Forsythia ovata TaxID=205694 RepID=A0ABD1WFS3_9LAMI